MNFLSSILEGFFDWTVRHYRLTVFVFGVLAAVLFLAVPDLRTELRIYEMTDPAFPSTERLENMKQDFEDGNSTIFIFSNQTGSHLTYRQFCAIRDWLHAEKFSNHNLKSVASPFGLRKPSPEGDKLWYRTFLDVDCKTLAKSDLPASEMSKLKDTPWNRVMTNPKLSDLAIELVYSDLDPPEKFGRFNPKVIGETLINAQQTLETPELNLKIYLSGRAAPQYQFMDAMSKDMLVNAAVFVLCILVLRLFFGTWAAGFLFAGMIGFCFVSLLGGMSLLDIPLDMLTSNLLLMLCVAGLGDYLFILQAQMQNKEDLTESFRNLVLPGFLTSLTTFVGFWSLNVSDIQLIQRFGTAAAVGTVFEWLATFILIPSILRFFPSTFRLVNSGKAWRPSGIRQLTQFSPGRWVRQLALMAFVLSCSGWFFLRYEDSINTNFPKNHLHTQTFEYTKKTRDWEGIVQVVFPATMEKEDVSIALQKLTDLPVVKNLESSDTLLPFYLDHLDTDTRALVHRELSLTPVLQRFDASGGLRRATLYISDFNLSTLTTVNTAVEQVCEGLGCYATGEGIVYAEFSSRLIPTLLESFLLSILLVALTLFAISGHLPMMTRIQLMVSSFWGPILMLGIMALFRVPVNQATSLFAAILVGMAGDNAIQYICAGRKKDLEDGIEEKAESSVRLTGLLCVLSLCFLFLTLVPMQMLGALFFTGFALTFIGDLWLLKGFVDAPVRLKRPIETCDTLS